MWRKLLNWKHITRKEGHYKEYNTTVLKSEEETGIIRKTIEKAAVLAETAGVHLGGICKIDYSWGEIDIYSQSFEMMECNSDLRLSEAGGDAYHIDIEADDIDVQDTVTVIWEIE